MQSPLDQLAAEVSRCRVCRDTPQGRPLPHDPRPVMQVSEKARILLAGQAPGTRVHQSGKPFTDPSGMRLRSWLAMTEEEFYESGRLAIVPMGFCFPGLDAKGGDLPPRRECAPLWRARVLAQLPKIELVLAVGTYAQAWHLPHLTRLSLTARVAHWREQLMRTPPVIPLPHPSWRNNAWLKRNPWFEAELLPVLQARVRALLDERNSRLQQGLPPAIGSP
jgi:uracil-DNA glycosylase